MSGALAVIDGPDLFGTAPSDLVPDVAEFADSITARQRAERIRAQIVSYHQMRQDIADSFAYRDWAALGYSSWYGYLEGEFGPELQQLSRHRGQRADAARDLRAGGLSTRQIASVLDVDAKTVRNDLEGAPAPETVTGADGKTYPASRASQSPAGTPAAPAAAGIEGPAGPAADASGTASAASGRDRPGPPSDSPAGRDLQAPAFVSGEAGSAAVATAGQPGDEFCPSGWVASSGATWRCNQEPGHDGQHHDGAGVRWDGDPAAEHRVDRRAQITANVGQLALAVNNLRALLRDATVADLPLFALRQQRDDLDRLIQRLEATATTEGTPA